MAVGFDKFDVEKEREKLRKLSDAELIREGKAARFMCSPETNFGKPPLNVYVKEEWAESVTGQKNGSSTLRDKSIR